ncbi:MAG: bifunctional precorrin-2 dehydrogenase/sirohydrochlorin ferrochelatase [Candidatus Eiseniibacteriota bacterium]|nr:MAG: bifunctional precorrin-2 dehydrogenase/sirohydrochlorin ferrochelatase [Candidatus Eisenbacteria bacterium]
MKDKRSAEKTYYPIFVELSGKKCVVVGGGTVAERKVRTLLEHGARVVVVSPRLSRGLSNLKKRGLVEHLRRGFRKGDCRGSLLVFAATDSRKVNSAVAEEASCASGLVNVVDTPEFCSFIVPSIVKRGALSVAISTSGKSPALSKAIRKLLEGELSQEMGALVSTLGEMRQRLREKIPEAQAKRKKKLTRAAERVLARSRARKAQGGRKKCR